MLLPSNYKLTNIHCPYCGYICSTDVKDCPKCGHNLRNLTSCGACHEEFIYTGQNRCENCGASLPNYTHILADGLHAPARSRYAQVDGWLSKRREGLELRVYARRDEARPRVPVEAWRAYLRWGVFRRRMGTRS